MLLFSTFSKTLTTIALDQSRLWQFATCSCKPVAEGLLPSLTPLAAVHRHDVTVSWRPFSASATNGYECILSPSQFLICVSFYPIISLFLLLLILTTRLPLTRDAAPVHLKCIRGTSKVDDSASLDALNTARQPVTPFSRVEPLHNEVALYITKI